MSEKPTFNHESQENEPKAKLGDYVTATLVEKTITEDYPEGLNEPRQGVFVKDKGDGTIVLQDERGKYICSGPEDITVVPDKNLSPDSLEFVKEQRKKLGL